MRILHLNEHLDWKGGVEVYLLHLLPELERLGHEVMVGFAQGQAELATYPVLLTELSGADQTARNLGHQKTKALIRQYRPDVVHIHQTHNRGIIEACLETTPTIIHGHDYRYLCPASTFFYRRSETLCARIAGPACFAVTLTRHCLTPRPQYTFPYYQRVRWTQQQRHRFAHVIAPSESCRQRFLQAGFAAKQVTTLPYFCPIPGRDQPRPLPTHPTLLFIGRTTPNKGARYFVEALGQLPERVQGIMIGDFIQASHNALIDLARAAGCADRLVFQPWAEREAINAAFEQASVFIFPSIWPETLGIVGLEALATGVPVVASDIGGVREWLRDGETGFLVVPKDANAIAARAEQLLTDTTLNQAMGINGLTLIRNQFSTAYHLDRLIAVYEGVQ